MNRNISILIAMGITMVVSLFTIPFLGSPMDTGVYWDMLRWLIPLILIICIGSTIPFILSNWDIHFGDFELASGNQLRTTITNRGTTPFNFNRIQFASTKKYWIFGKREFPPQEGIYAAAVECHGGETLSQLLHEHIGLTIRKGMPITLTIRDAGNKKVKEYLKHFEKGKKIHLCLYYYGTNERIFS